MMAWHQGVRSLGVCAVTWPRVRAQNRGCDVERSVLSVVTVKKEGWLDGHGDCCVKLSVQLVFQIVICARVQLVKLAWH